MSQSSAESTVPGVITMAHAAEKGAENDSIFLAPVSSTSVMQIWHRIRLVGYQKPAPIRTLLYFQARNWRARN